ncbi:MAG: hypothetical protein Q8P24_04125 [Desulfobacterales bacterium]|nr:hypothetical protein [Desulfobacterales bacterium]
MIRKFDEADAITPARLLRRSAPVGPAAFGLVDCSRRGINIVLTAAISDYTV